MKKILSTEKLLPFLKARFNMNFETKGLEVVRTLNELTSDADDPQVAICRISNDQPDADGDLMVSTGCNFEEFQKRGVIVLDHNYDALSCVANPTKVQVDEHAIYGAMKFGTTQICKDVNSLVHDKVIKGVSVGFVSDKEVCKGQAGWLQALDTYAKHLTDAVKEGLNRIVIAWTLLEVSIVGLGSNADAVFAEFESKNYKLSADTKKRLSGKVEHKEMTADEALTAKPVVEDIVGEPLKPEVCTLCGKTGPNYC